MVVAANPITGPHARWDRIRAAVLRAYEIRRAADVTDEAVDSYLEELARDEGVAAAFAAEAISEADDNQLQAILSATRGHRKETVAALVMDCITKYARATLGARL
jgi:protein-tyrosine-phosphatase